MPELKFSRQPGMVRDLTFLYTLHYNPDLWDKEYCDYNHLKSDQKYYNEVLEKFPEFPEDFKVFFYSKDDAYTFFIEECICKYELPLAEKWDFDNIKKRIKNTDLMVYKMIQFYFPQEITAYYEKYGYQSFLQESPYFCGKDSAVQRRKLIRKSELPVEIKYNLLEFFEEPEEYLQRLVHDMDIKYTLLNVYYNGRMQELLVMQEQFDYLSFWENLRKFPNMQLEVDELNTIYISFTFIHKYLIYLDRNTNMILLGSDYKEKMDSIINAVKKIDISEAGRILSDKNRITIIKFLGSATDRTTSEIAKRLNLSLNATIYHLAMMTKAGMVKSRDVGRTVYYWINKPYMEQLGNEICVMYQNDTADTDNV